MPNLIGQSLGRYHILEQLGEGGMATVYKAYDTRLERDVAVKIIRRKAFPEDQLDCILKRFEREAKALARLTHPNIVPVIDYGDYEGAPYLVMPYLPGGTLKQKLGKPMPWQESVRILLPIAQALEYAHEQNIIHRDIKPSNILLTVKGQPMLSDFGIAKILESDDTATLTGVGVGVGTPEYMAPEQWIGGAGPQSDIYSLGVVLYELVTGRKPYIADTPAAILLKQATEPLPRPAQFVPGLPEVVEKVLFKALARKPEDRYADMAALSAAMETSLSWQNQPSRYVGRPAPDLPGMDDSMETIEQEDMQNGLPPESTLAAHQPVVERPSSEIARLQRKSKFALIRKEWGKVIQIISRLKKLSPGSRPPRDRQQKRLPKTRISIWWIIGIVIVGILAVIGVLMKTGVFTPKSAQTPGTIVQPASSAPAANGYMYFTSNEDHGKAEVWIMDPKSNVFQVTHTPDPNESWSPAPAANGYLYFTSNESGRAEVWIMDPKSNVFQVTHTPDPNESWSPAPAVNGYLYFTSNESGKAEVWIMDPKSNVFQVTHTPDPYESWSPAPAANGYVYFTSNEDHGKAEVWIMDPKSNVFQVTHTPDPNESWSPAPAANGYLYFTSNESGRAEVWIMDPKSNVFQVTHTPDPYESWSPAPAANGYVYFTSNEDHGKAEVWIMDPKSNVFQVTHTPDPYESWVYYFNKPQPNPKR